MHVTRITVSKGKTYRPDPAQEEWIRNEYTLEIEISDDKELPVAREWALSLIDSWLEVKPGFEPGKIPEFNPDDLMQHEWKGKRLSDGEYAKGSLSWGWDFRDNFPESVIKVLEKGPLTIDQYEFSLSDTGNLVYARKKKAGG